MKRFAVFLALAWAGFWMLFGVVSGMAEGLSPFGSVVHGAFPLVMRNRPLASIAFIMITMALPPAISGAILLSQNVGRKPPA